MRIPGLVVGALVAAAWPLAAQLTITTKSLPFGGLNQGYSAQFTTSGAVGSTNWTITSGNTPPGINFNVDTGAFFGAPTAVGTFHLSVRVNDQMGQVASGSFSIGVMQISTPVQLPAGSTCGHYSVTFRVSDGPAPPFTWSIVGGGQPPGLNLDSNTGVLSGTPTQSGPFEFEVMAFSPQFDISATQTFFVSIIGLCFITTSLPNGDLNSFYRESVIISGGQAPYHWMVSSGSLPNGVTISATNGALSGIPTATGNFTFTLQVTDNMGMSTSQFYSVVINPALLFTSTSPLPQAISGASYADTLGATGGQSPYTFASADPPTGLTLSTAGVLSGIPAAGTYVFTATVTDSLGISVSMDFKLVVISAGPVLQVTPMSLTFNAPFEGSPPQPQFVDVTPAGTQPVSFQVFKDGGDPSTPAPSWITVNQGDPNAPTRLVVSVNQGTMATQMSSARIRVTDTFGNAVIVSVTLNVTSAAPQLDVTPHTLHFGARVGAPGTLVALLGVRNTGGGGAVSFSTSVQGNSRWIGGLSPSSGQTSTGSTVFLKVQVNTQGLAIGSYHDVIVFTWSGGTINIPVALFVSGNGAILGLSVTGIRFQARQGGGYSNAQTVEVLNLGDPASSLNWTAAFVSGSDSFSASSLSGTATQANPGMITLTPTAAALQGNAGGVYGLLKISSLQASNSPLYIVLVLDLQSTASPALPDPAPGGLVFVATAGQVLANGQVVTVNTSSAEDVAFQAAVFTANGGQWLSVDPTSGSTNGVSPGQISVTVDATKLAPGIYSGEVDISISGVLRSVNVTLIVQPAAGVAARAGRGNPLPATISCTPAALAITETGLVNNFAVPAGWPAALIVQLNDDCGNLVSGGSVTASFSNTDPPLELREGQPATYTATWQPGVVLPQMTITLDAQASKLKQASALLIGSVNANANTPPSLFENGTVNVFNRVPAGALSPGMIIEVYGTGLATAKGNPGVLPLPNVFQGTSLIVGPDQTPLYFVSAGQLDVQVAAELVANQQYPVIAALNGAYSVPVMADIAPIQLGVAATTDGHAIAQHGSNSAYVTAGSPAKPGEVLVIYLSAMGPTNPPVPSGVPAPSEPLARVSFAPTVTLDGSTATVQFAGLTPGLVGLYQINFQVPKSARTGDLTLIVSQNGVSSNTTRIPVAK